MIERTPAILFAFFAAAASAGAEDAPSPGPKAADTASVILAPTPAAAVPVPIPRTAADSGDPKVTAEIASLLPPFNPNLSLPKNAVGPVSKPADTPKNGIPRLPYEVMRQYVVHGARPPVFRQRDLYTREGLIDLAFKEHPLLRIGNFFGLKRNIAHRVMIDEALAESREDLTDTALAMASAGDPEEARVLQQAIIDEGFEDYGGDGGGGPVGVK